ncbi:MAG: nitroreductase family protein [Anaerolineae bacterium]|nr:nitroreductase family protein [Anaerolineae bacterium]
MSFLTFLTSRRSIRRYRPEPVPDEIVRQLLAAATYAPSAHNRQPWRFAVISSPETKQQLAAAMGARLRADLQADGVPPEQIEQDAGRSYQRLTNAPLLILLCMSMVDMDSYRDERRQQHEWTMATQSVAMAGQNLLLAAHAVGLGGCWLCAPLFCPDVVQGVLNLPPDWQPQGLITLGYPAENKQKDRAPLDSKMVWMDEV